MNKIKEWIKNNMILTSLVGILIMALWVTWAAANAMAFVECYRYHWATDRDYKVSFGVCYIKTDKGWFERQQLRSAE